MLMPEKPVLVTGATGKPITAGPERMGTK